MSIDRQIHHSGGQVAPFPRGMKKRLVTFGGTVLLSMVACMFAAIIALFPQPAVAEPLGFRRARATFSLGLDAFDAVTGDFGKVSEVGMAVFAESSIQLWGYFGINIRFGSARAFTDKNFLPYDNGYQYICFTLSPRFYLAPFRKLNLYFYAQPEISMDILTSNTLVKMTGNENLTGAAGGAIGAQLIVGMISISGQVYCEYNWNFESVIIGGGLAVGVTSTIR